MNDTACSSDLKSLRVLEKHNMRMRYRRLSRNARDVNYIVCEHLLQKRIAKHTSSYTHSQPGSTAIRGNPP